VIAMIDYQHELQQAMRERHEQGKDQRQRQHDD
jgi:hypothetical protein